MADKKFGVRQIDLVGSSGATNIESPNTLNLKSTQVSISTDMSIGGNVVSDLIVGAVSRLESEPLYQKLSLMFMVG